MSSIYFMINVIFYTDFGNYGFVITVIEQKENYLKVVKLNNYI